MKQGIEKILTEEQNAIEAEICAAYIKDGKTVAFDIADKYKDQIVLEYCDYCERNSPTFKGKHYCIICSQPTKPQETASSNDSLEDKKYWTPGGMVDGYGLRCTDGRELIKQEAFNGLENEQTRAEILTALNNYNALKQSNKELIEALENLIQGENCDINQSGWNVINSALQKAKTTINH